MYAVLTTPCTGTGRITLIETWTTWQQNVDISPSLQFDPPAMVSLLLVLELYRYIEYLERVNGEQQKAVVALQNTLSEVIQRADMPVVLTTH